MATVNEQLLDKFIRHSVYLERFKNSEAKKIAGFLQKDVIPQVEAKIATALSRKVDPTRLKQLNAALDRMMQVAMVKAGKQTVSTLTDLSRYEAEWAADTIKKTIPLDIGMTMPSAEVLRQLVTTRPMDGRKLSAWLKGYSNAARTKMMKQISVGMAMGESLPHIGKRIRQVMSIKRKQAEYIARTAVSNVVHNARDEVYKQNKELIKKYQFVATLDTRTTLTCINYDGQVFNVGEGPRPPIHFNCRSTTIPVVTGWQELGIEPPPPATRASMNGAVPEKTTYVDWFKRQTKATQVEVLGAKRWAMYKAGMPLRNFVSKDYTPLSLDQLADMEGLAAFPEPQRLAIKRWRRLKRKYKETGDEKFLIKQQAVEQEMRAMGLKPEDWMPRTGSTGPLPRKPKTKSVTATTAAEYRKAFLKKADPMLETKARAERLQRQFLELDKKKWNLIDQKNAIRSPGAAELKLKQELLDQIEKLNLDMAKVNEELNKLNSIVSDMKTQGRKLLYEKSSYKGWINFGKFSGKTSAANDVLHMIPKGRLMAGDEQVIKKLVWKWDKQVGNGGVYYKAGFNKATIGVGHRSGKHVFAHEFGHHLGYTVYQFDDAGQAFFRKRTMGESIAPLPGYGTDQYGRQIVGKRDKFKDIYAGRVYADGRAPEVISVGVERLWADPIEFAQEDPDWFEFTIKWLKGFKE